MKKKRGWFVIVLILLLGSLFTAQAQEDAADWVTASYFGDMDLDCDGPHHVQPDTVLAADGELSDCADEEDNPVDFIQRLRASSGSQTGCALVMSEDDHGTEDDDCSIALVPTGFRLDQNFRPYRSLISVTAVWEGDSGGASDLESSDWDWQSGYSWDDPSDSDPYDAAACHALPVRLSADIGSYICSEDTQWLLCDADHAGQRLTGNAEYDAVNYLFECQCENNACSWEELGRDDDRDGFTPAIGDCRDDPSQDPEFCQDIHDGVACDSDPALYAVCAACINPEAPEICGDGIDNSCRTNLAESSVLSVTDDCDLLDRNTCNANTFDWLDNPSDTTAQCCGDDGIADLGKQAKVSSGYYTCLNKNTELVTTGGGESVTTVFWQEATTLSSSEDTGVVSGCQGDWCWVPANGQPQFTIFTIKKPGEAAYDIVSNNQRWVECDTANSGQSLIPSEIEFEQKNERFFCYDQGNKKVWAECCTDATCTQDKVNGIKIRQPGQHAFALPLLENGRTILLQEISASFSEYEKVYGKNDYLDFTNYDFLDLYFTFTEQVPPATTINAEVRGTQGNLFSGELLSYAINGVSFEPNKIMHAQIPVQDWRDVTFINFASPDDAPFTISSVQLVKQGTNPICSASSTWASDIDAIESTLESGTMCQNNNLVWLGDDVPLPARCCGDDPAEFYEDTEQGCWNSQPIAAAERFSEIEFELTSDTGQWEYSYDTQPVSVIAQIQSSKGEITTRSFSGNVVASSTPVVLGSIELQKDTFIELQLQDTQGGSVYLIDPLRPLDRLEELQQKDITQRKKVFYVMAERSGISRSYAIQPQQKRTIRFACFQETCYYPLQGNPPYTIKNLHPEQYDLYYVNQLDDNQQVAILLDIEKEIFAQQGWLEARHVPLTLMYNGTQFLRCGIPSGSIETPNPLADPASAACTIQNQYFCDAVSGWSDKPYAKQEYSQDGILQPAVPNQEITAEQRNHSSSIVFGRNILFNPRLTK